MTTMDGNERDQRTSAIIGAAMEVHGVLGAGFLELVYSEALAIDSWIGGSSFGAKRHYP